MMNDTEDDPLEALKKLRAQKQESDPLEELKRLKAERATPDLAPRESTRAETRPPASTLSPLAALAPLAQGMTMGAADEILGAVEGANQALHGGSFSKGYEEGRDKVRAGTKQYAEEHPKASTALTIAGGVAPAVLAPGRTLIKAGMPLAKRAAIAAAEGAGFGGAAGALSADEDRVGGAVGGALIGGGLGAALPVAGAGINIARNVFGRSGAAASQHADALVVRALQRDKANPQTLRDATGKPTILADLAGENTLGLARGAQATPSEAKNALPEFLHARQAAQPTRVLGDLEGAAGRQNENVHDTAEQLLETRKNNAAPLYEEAYAHGPVDLKEVSDALKIPQFRRAYERGRRIAKADGVKLPRIFKEVTEPGKTLDASGNPVMVTRQKLVAVPNVQAVDYMKRGMDDVIQSGMAKGSIGRTEARVLKKRLASVLGAVDEAVPKFKEARGQFAGDSDMMEALDAGRNFLKEDYRVTQKQLAAMTDGEREMHKAGAIDAIRRQIDEAPDGADVVKRIFGNPRKRDQLKVLIGDDAFNTLEERLGVESKMVRTKDKVTGGSPTARIQTELAELGDGGLAQAGQALISGNPKTAAIRAVASAVKSRAQGNVGPVAEEVTKRLMLTPGTPQYRAWLTILERQQQDALRTSLPKTVARRALVAGATNHD